MTLPRNVRAIRALYLHQNVLVLELNMQKSLVVNPHTLGREYRAFIAIDMVHELNMQKSLVVNQIHVAHRLVKDTIVTHYAGTNADLTQSCV